jgi:hypothetical protein
LTDPCCKLYVNFYTPRGPYSMPQWNESKGQQRWGLSPTSWSMLYDLLQYNNTNLCDRSPCVPPNESSIFWDRLECMEYTIYIVWNIVNIRSSSCHAPLDSLAFQGAQTQSPCPQPNSIKTQYSVLSAQHSWLSTNDGAVSVCRAASCGSISSADCVLKGN